MKIANTLSLLTEDPLYFENYYPVLLLCILDNYVQLLNIIPDKIA